MAATKLYRQICAALLLLLMLFTTAVQITHSHAVKQNAELQVKSSSLQLHEHYFTAPGAHAKCFIHEYQLTKDADFSISLFLPANNFCRIINTAVQNTRLTALYNSDFESRGPPAIFLHV